VTTASSFNCPQCGGTLEVRAPGRTETIVCLHCGAALDAKDPKHQIVDQHRSAVEKTKIPIGARGTLRGEEFEVIGWMRRAVNYEGVQYLWEEYLLYNPYKGYRWLTESYGHWTLLKPLPQPPKESK
jgi:hypothetical protein